MHTQISAWHCFSFINRFLDSNMAMGNDFVQYISEISNDLHKKSIPLRASLFNYTMFRKIIYINSSLIILYTRWTVRFKVLQEYKMIITSMYNFTIALILDRYIVSLKEFKVVQIYQVTKTQNELKICKL